ncbi:cell division protein FtsZ [archaeon]|nr:cell division protein FtsZ [archaeon]
MRADQQKLEQLAQSSKPAVMAVGIGGAGCNIISWIKKEGVTGGRLISVNTDATHLSISEADSRILIGEKTTKGLGCGGYPKIGEQAMQESIQEVFNEVENSNILFLVAGLGGGTGTGGIVHLSRELQKKFKNNSVQRLIIGVATLPFQIETARMGAAKAAIQQLKHYCDTVVIIDNDRLNHLAGNLPFKEALGVANTTIGKFVKGVTETITAASLINIDYADLRAIMHNAGIASIGIGQGKDDGKVEHAVEDITKARGVLIHISGGEDMTLEEVHRGGELIKRYMPPKSKVIWGAKVDEKLKGRAEVMVVITGVDSAFLQTQKKRLGRFKLPW